MSLTARRLFIVMTIILGIVALLGQSPPQAGAQDPKKDIKDPKKGDPDPKTVEAQKKTALDYWKDVFDAEKPNVAETAHFLMVGGKPGKDHAKELARIGGDLEQQYVKACTVLKMDKNPAPWKGKLTVFIVSEADKYPRMIRGLERRKADDDETGSSDGLGNFPYVVACAGKLPSDLGATGNAGAHMVALVMTFKVKTPLPEWLNEGFGRATVLHVWAGTALAGDRKKASAIVTKSNRTVDDIFNGNLTPNEQSYLRGSIVDYLAYSGRTAKFLPFLEGFRADANGNPGTVQTALKNANITSADLTANWQKYVKTFK
jgi:hypothetical protein